MAAFSTSSSPLPPRDGPAVLRSHRCAPCTLASTLEQRKSLRHSLIPLFPADKHLLNDPEAKNLVLDSLKGLAYLNPAVELDEENRGPLSRRLRPSASSNATHPQS